MFPWQIKRMLVIVHTLCDGIFLSITHFSRQVESHLQVGRGGDLFRQLQLGPSEPAHRLDVPQLFLERQFCLEDDHVLGPADIHGLGHHLRGVLIGPVKVPHPAQVPGGEPRSVRVHGMQIRGCGHSRALFRPAVDQTANLTVQLHLRRCRRHQRVQSGVQIAVIRGFPDVHEQLPFWRGAPDFGVKQREHGVHSRAPVRPACGHILEIHGDLTVELLHRGLMTISQFFCCGGPDAWPTICFRCDHAALLEQLVDQL